jgi:DNA-binding transcriptional ArsR family regulator
VEKGWVREGILSSLSKGPATMTQISSQLEISKSTASYHLSRLLARRVIEIVDARPGRGRVVVKKYGLKEGSLVMFPTLRQEETELGRLRETFELQALGWRSGTDGVDLTRMESLLYKLFLHLFRITRSEHMGLMLEYGQRTGEILADTLPPNRLRRTLPAIAEYLSRSKIADADLIQIQGSPITVLHSNTCIGSSIHQGNPCYFLEGIVRGIIAYKLGSGVQVLRVAPPDLSGCYLAIGRVKNLDLSWVAEALLTSPYRRRRSADLRGTR